MKPKSGCRPMLPLNHCVSPGPVSGRLHHILLLICLLLPWSANAQESAPAVAVTGGVDLVSRYLWRGIEISESPSIQPCLAVNWKGFSLGSWGAYKLTGPGNQETDFFLSKSFGFVTLSLWDYWNFNDTAKLDFFDYRKGTTPHIIESQLILNGGERLPFRFLTSWFFYGADHPGSIYLELEYHKHTAYADFQVFAGYQARGTYYAPKTGFVNLGGMVKKSIRISEYFDLPLSLSLIFNPQSRSAYLVGGIAFLLPPPAASGNN